MAKNFEMPPLKIGDLEARLPIIQGGMGVGISLSGLAGAVAKEGGIGVLSAIEIGTDEIDFEQNYLKATKRALTREIKRAKEISEGGIIGLNIMVAVTDFEDLVAIAAESEIDILFFGAGLLLGPPKCLPIERIKKTNIKIVPIVSSGRAVKVIFESWARRYNYIPDAVVIEGPLAGGHLGFKKENLNDKAYCLENLFKDIKSEIIRFEERFNRKIPVIAGGGIFSGEDIYKMISLGADGVQMGTRFVATDDCDASYEFKKMYIDAQENDITIIDSPVGLPGRAINNSFLNDVKLGRNKPFKCNRKCLKSCKLKEAPYCINQALVNSKKEMLKKVLLLQEQWFIK